MVSESEVRNKKKKKTKVMKGKKKTLLQKEK